MLSYYSIQITKKFFPNENKHMLTTLDEYKDRSEVRVRGEVMVVIKVAEHKTGAVASAKIILKHEYTILMVPKLNQIGFPLKTGPWFSKIPAPLKLLPASGATVTQKNCSKLFH